MVIYAKKTKTWCDNYIDNRFHNVLHYEKLEHWIYGVVLMKKLSIATGFFLGGIYMLLVLNFIPFRSCEYITFEGTLIYWIILAIFSIIFDLKYLNKKVKK